MTSYIILRHSEEVQSKEIAKLITFVTHVLKDQGFTLENILEDAIR